jgi:hypothetical protein
MAIVTGGSRQGEEPEVLQASDQQPDQEALAKREKSRIYRQWVAQNRERRRASQKAWYQKNQLRVGALHQAYYWDNREHERARSRKYYRGHHVAVRKRHRQYYTRKSAAKLGADRDGV